jgi:cation diffusion facilitator family transporter
MHTTNLKSWQHDHNFHVGVEHGERNTRRVMLLTAAMMVTEIIAGILSGSMALLADGWHMAIHVAAFGIAAFAYSYARRHAGNKRFTFGTGKVGDLGGYTSAVVLPMNLRIGFEFCQAWQDNLTELFGQPLQRTSLGFQDLLLVLRQSLFDIAHSFDHHPPEPFGQLTRQSDVGHQATPPPRHSPVKSAQGNVFAAGQAAPHHTEHPSGTIAFAPHRSFPFAALVTAGRQTKPGREVFLGRPFRQVGAHFAQQLQQAVVGVRRQHRQILAVAELEQQTVQSVDLWRIDAQPFRRRSFRSRRRWGLLRPADLTQHRFNLPVARGDLPLEVLPVFHRLAQRKQMFLGPGAAQRLPDPLGFLLLNLHVAQGQQSIRIALPCQNGCNDFDPAGSHQTADDVVQLHIHPFQGFLLVLNAGRRAGQVVGPQPQVILQAPDFGWRHEARAQQSMSVKRGAPLTILHVRLAPRQVACVFAVDHEDFETSGFQHAVEWQPVDPGGFHRDRLDCAFLKPVAQSMKFRSHGAENLGRPASDGDKHLFAADIDEGGQRIQNRQSGCRCHSIFWPDTESPMEFWKKQIFPTGKPTRASPKCAEVHHRNQSFHRAQGTKGCERPHCSRRRSTAQTLSGSWAVSRSKRNKELSMIALFMAWESARRIFHPVLIHFNEAIAIATVGLTVNLISAWLLKDHHHHGHGHHEHNADHHHHEHERHADHNLRAAYIHVLADALTSVTAIAALLSGKFLGWNCLDPVVGIVGSVVIASWAYSLVRNTSEVLLDGETAPHLKREIHEAVEQDDSEARIADLHVWQVGVGQFSAIVSIVAHEPKTPQHYKKLVGIHEELVHVTVEVSRCEEVTGLAV